MMKKKNKYQYGLMFYLLAIMNLQNNLIDLSLSEFEQANPSLLVIQDKKAIQ